MTIALTRLSILALYTRIFYVETTFVRVARVMMALTVLWCIGSIMQTLLICHPIEYTWNKKIAGSCGRVRAAIIALGAFTALSEVVLFIMPLPLIFKMKLPVEKKVGLGCVFGLGVLSVAHFP